MEERERIGEREREREKEVADATRSGATLYRLHHSVILFPKQLFSFALKILFSYFSIIKLYK